MNLFKKKESPAQNIAFMAIMAAINVIFLLLTNFVPFLLFLLIFILPLSCTLVILLCKKKYFIAYAGATLGLCLIITFWNISETLFYIIPSLITGFVFGVLIERKIPYAFSIMSATFVQFGLSYLLLPIIELITQVNLLTSFATMFNIHGDEFEYYILTFGVFFVSFMQEIVSYVFIRFGLKNLNYMLEEQEKPTLLNLTLLINLLLSLFFFFVVPELCYIFLFNSAYFAYFAIIRLIKSKKLYNHILLVVGAVLIFFIFAILYPYIKEPLQLISVGIYLLLVNILSFIKTN